MIASCLLPLYQHRINAPGRILLQEKFGRTAAAGEFVSLLADGTIKN
jgi:hypothetical protein